MHDTIEIKPKAALDAVVTLPGSKSITHRALFCAALAEGVSTIENALFCTDTQISAECLSMLGADIEADGKNTLFRVTGGNGLLRLGSVRLNAGECGTALRFLAAVLTLGQGDYTLEGGQVPRPVGDLVDALNGAGCNIRYEKAAGYPPLRIVASGFPGGKIPVSGEVSSQFISAILLAAPYANRDTEIEVAGKPASAPYIDVTIDVMREFAINVVKSGGAYYVPAGFGYEGTVFRVEGDASAASYFLAAAAVCGGRVRVNGIGKGSRQADARFAAILEDMGCGTAREKDFIQAEGPMTKGTHADMRDIPDAVPTLAAAACFAQSKTLITGVKNLRHKESDRVAAISETLRALGARIETGEDSIEIYPSRMHGGKIDPRNDHRIAMAAALVGLKTPGVMIRNPGCVAKSFPKFFAEIENLSERSKS
jgi:3-phosphoshikimate 1-carboxyvinyltransferase